MKPSKKGSLTPYIFAGVYRKTEPSSRKACSILSGILLRDKKGEPAGSSGFILEHAGKTLAQLCHNIRTDGYQLRFDVPDSANLPGKWPRFVPDATLKDTLRKIQDAARDEAIYPISIWGMPLDRIKETNRAIDEFYSGGRFGGLFDGVMSLGGLRVSLTGSSIDLSINCRELDKTIVWMRDAYEFADAPVVWDEENIVP